MLKGALPKIVTSQLPGPKARKILDRRNEAVPTAIPCNYPCVIKDGSGAVFEDVDGNIFLDWIGGVGVLNIGYSQPEVVEAVKDQANYFFHAMQNIVSHEGYVELAEKMNEIVPVRGDKKRTMFANSGAEADENAVKIAKSYTKRPNIIVFSGAFHGRTLLTMTMTSKKSYSKGLGPYPDGVYRAEFPDLYHRPKGMTEEEAIAYFIKRLEVVFEEASPAEYVAAIVVEPIQGEGGFVPAPFEWVKAVRKICDDNGILLVADEVQTGFGRSGKMFVSDYWAEIGCAPDIMTCAKSIAGGVPLSAVTAREEIMEGIARGIIGGTYNGNALACAASLKIIEIMKRDNLPGRAMAISHRVKDALCEWKKMYPCIGDIRGIGAMLGVEFVKDPVTKEPDAVLVQSLIKETTKRGLLVENAGTHGNVIRFLCPLVVTDEQLEAGLAIFKEALEVCCERHPK